MTTLMVIAFAAFVAGFALGGLVVRWAIFESLKGGGSGQYR